MAKFERLFLSSASNFNDNFSPFVGYCLLSSIEKNKGRLETTPKDSRVKYFELFNKFSETDLMERVPLPYSIPYTTARTNNDNQLKVTRWSHYFSEFDKKAVAALIEIVPAPRHSDLQFQRLTNIPPLDTPTTRAKVKRVLVAFILGVQEVLRGTSRAYASVEKSPSSHELVQGRDYLTHVSRLVNDLVYKSKILQWALNHWLRSFLNFKYTTLYTADRKRADKQAETVEDGGEESLSENNADDLTSPKPIPMHSQSA